MQRLGFIVLSLGINFHYPASFFLVQIHVGGQPQNERLGDWRHSASQQDKKTTCSSGMAYY